MNDWKFEYWTFFIKNHNQEEYISSDGKLSMFLNTHTFTLIFWPKQHFNVKQISFQNYSRMLIKEQLLFENNSYQNKNINNLK